ncbi:MAG: hypothetical protein EPN89_09145 [Methylovulum sp.]|nr:MAG: hypothetical protein EPN89_09145 [Methylovulum sp.]
MNPQQTNTAHSLYALYETLPANVQQTFLEELVQKKHREIKALAFSDPIANEKRNTVILGVMEDAFSIPDNFDAALPEDMLNEFYTHKL